jgi:hypothetical protein
MNQPPPGCQKKTLSEKRIIDYDNNMVRAYDHQDKDDANDFSITKRLKTH